MRITKKLLRHFAREVKGGIVGNWYTLEGDGSILESCDSYTYTPGVECIAQLQCMEGMSIKGILEHLEMMGAQS